MIKVQRLTETANLPFQATEGSAGYDLFADESKMIRDRKLISTGVAVQIPQGYVGVIKSRSSMAVKGFDAQAGVIDSDYTGEIKVLLSNDKWPNEVCRIVKGDKIAQMLVVPCAHFDVVEVDSLDDTERGAGGFGSTGK